MSEYFTTEDFTLSRAYGYLNDVTMHAECYGGYIAYLQQEAGFVVVMKKSDYRLGHRNTGEPYEVATNHEIIGNIFENSGLLEGVIQ